MVRNMRVLNKHKDDYTSLHNGVDIMRGSRWGNPFIVGPDGTREEVVELYRKYAEWRLGVQPDWLDPLVGKDVVCCCKPELCHGDVLVELLQKWIVGKSWR